MASDAAALQKLTRAIEGAGRSMERLAKATEHANQLTIEMGRLLQEKEETNG